MFCNQECFIEDFELDDSAYAFKHIPSNVKTLLMLNVLIKHMDLLVLEKLPRSVDTLHIQLSYALKWISIPRTLRWVTVVNSKLRRIDIAANSLMNYLDISSSDVVKVPLTIQNARKLSYLRISSSKLSAIDFATFCDHTAMKELLLDDNKIRVIANSANRYCGIYDSLISLVLSQNKLTAVNMELFNVFVKLNVLSLQSSSITSISGHLALETLSDLWMDGNGLEQLDLCGWNVPSLSNLALAANLLTLVPECINNLTNVHTLTLSSNRIFYFTIESVAKMSSLRTLKTDLAVLVNLSRGGYISIIDNWWENWKQFYDHISTANMNIN
uniref:Leucine rich immune protein (Coil-less) n=1 Tax=Anopheles christyi TaxID=43041 RepID=A0A182KDJ7_9DIPT